MTGASVFVTTERLTPHLPWCPQFKPAQAQEFMRVWVKGEEYKPYVASCTKPTAL